MIKHFMYKLKLELIDGTDYWDVTETYVTVEKEGKVIAEGRIAISKMYWEWNEEDDIHHRYCNSDDSTLILNGKRYDNPEAYEKEYGFKIVDWGDERDMGIYETEEEMLDDFEKFIEAEIEYQKESSDWNKMN